MADDGGGAQGRTRRIVGTAIVLLAAAGIVALSQRADAPPEGSTPVVQVPEVPETEAVADDQEVAEAAATERAATDEPPSEAAATPEPRAPSFDTFRLEDSLAIIAGLAEPGFEVEVLLDTESLGTATVDAGGDFVVFAPVPPSDVPRVLSLVARGPDGLTIPGAATLIVA
ncbi:MAG: hypothetical protein AAF914_07055, partial [Pseudomonadota bacterium]